MSKKENKIKNEIMTCSFILFLITEKKYDFKKRKGNNKKKKRTKGKEREREKNKEALH